MSDTASPVSQLPGPMDDPAAIGFALLTVGVEEAIAAAASEIAALGRSLQQGFSGGQAAPSSTPASAIRPGTAQETAAPTNAAVDRVAELPDMPDRMAPASIQPFAPLVTSPPRQGSPSVVSLPVASTQADSPPSGAALSIAPAGIEPPPVSLLSFAPTLSESPPPIELSAVATARSVAPSPPSASTVSSGADGECERRGAGTWPGSTVARQEPVSLAPSTVCTSSAGRLHRCRCIRREDFGWPRAFADAVDAARARGAAETIFSTRHRDPFCRLPSRHFHGPRQ